MKMITAILTMILSLSAFALEQEVTMTYMGTEVPGVRSFYTCDYARSQAKKHLKTLGATDVTVSCTGGLDVWARMTLPLNLRASFNLPTVTGEGVERVVIKGDNRNPSCGFNVKLINSLLNVFDNVEVVSKQTSCTSERSNFKYVLNVAR